VSDTHNSCVGWVSLGYGGKGIKLTAHGTKHAVRYHHHQSQTGWFVEYCMFTDRSCRRKVGNS